MSRLVTDHLPLLAGAPNGVKRLRELILELATKGRLLPRPEFGNLDNWQQLKLPCVATYRIGKTPPSKEPRHWDSNGLPWVSISDMEHFGVLTDTARKISQNTLKETFSYPIIRAGSLLMSFKLTVGKVCILGVDAYHNEAIISLQPKPGVSRDYLMRILPAIAQRGKTKSALMGATLNSSTLAELVIPLPSLDEQRAIVAKVDELMALCDRLETRQSDAQAAHARLVDELLGSLLQARDAEDFAECWGRVKGSFDVLFTTEQSLVLLKQAILQFGVMGLLVEESTAEPSSSFDLLKAISIQNGKPASPVQPIWKTPSAWAWTQLASILVYGPKNGISPKPVSHVTPIRCLTLGATTRGQFNESCYKFVDLDPMSAQKYLLKSGDLLIQRANSIDYVGVSAIYNGQDDVFIFPDLMMRMRVTEQMFLPFVHMCLSALPCREYLRSRATGTQGNMPKVNQGTVSETPIPVPPIEVQQRVVAKVDELMALCDRIKAKLTRAGELNERLAGTLVERAVS